MAGDVLSQSEIDALLSAISTGEMTAEDAKKDEETRKVKSYDFKRALRFSKDQIRSLTRIHENFARLLTTFFSAQLRNYVQITVVSVDQIPFEEFVRSIPNMTLINVFEVPPLDGNILMEIHPNIAYSMMDRLMGGTGGSYSNVDNLTEIETKIMTNLFERSFDNLREAWENVAEIDPILVELEVNPQFLQMISPNETVIVISLNTIIGDTSGMINICIPHVVLEPIVPNLSVRYWMQSNTKQMSDEQIRTLEGRVKQASLPVVTELGATDISVQDFLTMQIGDVLQLNQKIEDPLTIKVGTLPKFTGQAGKVGKKMAVQILDPLKGADEHE
ncbi:flagellar motor switch protein FliM [Caryophanon tenue]|uniref:Flagellar motor switch protein FliM n=1 Tax=Caryophanon tenue TaxID=33978 RepID=A0A1C0YKK1_9BACL|nr:flagellar motor switch protein FliM [Caryophanon tenue]OCS87683.1 flagellar motor switch protein FliM [Caryophanon tenue]